MYITAALLSVSAGLAVAGRHVATRKRSGKSRARAAAAVPTPEARPISGRLVQDFPQKNSAPTLEPDAAFQDSFSPAYDGEGYKKSFDDLPDVDALINSSPAGNPPEVLDRALDAQGAAALPADTGADDVTDAHAFVGSIDETASSEAADEDELFAAATVAAARPSFVQRLRNWWSARFSRKSVPPSEEVDILDVEPGYIQWSEVQGSEAVDVADTAAMNDDQGELDHGLVAANASEYGDQGNEVVRDEPLPPVESIRVIDDAHGEEEDNGIAWLPPLDDILAEVAAHGQASADAAAEESVTGTEEPEAPEAAPTVITWTTAWSPEPLSDEARVDLTKRLVLLDDAEYYATLVTAYREDEIVRAALAPLLEAYRPRQATDLYRVMLQEGPIGDATLAIDELVALGHYDELASIIDGDEPELAKYAIFRLAGLVDFREYALRHHIDEQHLMGLAQTA
jgi:hypothetical protein